MDCPKALENLSAHLDNALDSATREELEEHLRVCGGCRSELEALRSCVEAVSSMDRISAPPGFLAEVHEKIGDGAGWHRLLRKLTFPWPVKLPLHAAGAVAAVLLVMLMVPARETSRMVSQTPQKPMAEIPLDASRPSQIPRLTEETEQSRGIAADQPIPQVPPPGKKDGIIELVLLMEPSHSLMPAGPGQSLQQRPHSEAGLRTGAAQATPAPVSEASDAETASATARMREPVESHRKAEKSAKSLPQRPGTSAPPAPAASAPGDRDPRERASRVEEVIRRAGGTLIGSELDPVTGNPISLLVAIPSPRYPDLVALLQGEGRVQGPGRESFHTGHDGALQVRIRIEVSGK